MNFATFNKTFGEEKITAMFNKVLNQGGKKCIATLYCDSNLRTYTFISLDMLPKKEMKKQRRKRRKGIKRKINRSNGGREEERGKRRGESIFAK